MVTEGPLRLQGFACGSLVPRTHRTGERSTWMRGALPQAPGLEIGRGMCVLGWHLLMSFGDESCTVPPLTGIHL